MLLSGHSGPGSYQPIAGAIAKLGYYAVLLDGKDILTREQDGRDTYHGCCLIESMRAIERSARARSAAFELVVYPYGEHGFNLPGSGAYRGDDEADAWKRTPTLKAVQ